MSRTRAALAGLAGVMVVAGLWGPGCATYANYPSIGGDVAVNDPNTAPMPTLAVRAARWVVERYPVEGAYVVNLPRGMERGRAMSMVEAIGEGARVVSGESSGLPVYHVSRIWVRGDRGEVDVMRPVGEEAHQAVTVRLKNDLGRWVVTSTKVWPVGMGEAPDLYGWSEEG